ncbi:MAG: recombination protein RecR [Clostridia bacterium]|nr:recombination protein RecR [Clostridia bacterium]
MYSIESMNILQEWFSKLPGIGPKSARNLAYHLIEMDPEEVKQFAQDMYTARLAVRHCPICGNLTDREICSICDDDRRDHSTVCVVRDVKDVMAIERGHEYRGVYHVLQGELSPFEGIGPDELNLASLYKRIEDGGIKEVILATNADVKGESTAIYIAKQLEKYDVTVTRIAHGVPIGGELQNAGDETLIRSIEARRPY